MAILNTTPDSFSDGGKFGFSADDEAARVAGAFGRAQELVASGADIIDVGGESTRPGADRVTLEEELDRVIPVVRMITSELDTIVSVDTTRSEVAVAAVQAGAHLVNDVSGGQFDDAMHRRVAELGAPYIAMHMRGTPKTMQSMAVYSDLVGDVRRELHECVTDIVEAGVPLWDIIVDPGIGFAKTGDHNLQLLRQLNDVFPCPPGATPPVGQSEALR